jgi:hypothetical protein
MDVKHKITSLRGGCDRNAKRTKFPVIMQEIIQPIIELSGKDSKEY